MSNTVTRIFKYDQHTIPDPGSQWTIDQVREHLSSVFPELAHATHSTQTVDEKQVITFRKQATQKG